MLIKVWLFIGLVALLATGLAMLTNDNGVAIMTGVLGFVAWGYWSFGALNIEIVSNGSTIAQDQQAVALLGIALAMIPGYIAFTGPVEIIERFRSPSPDEV